MPSNLDLYLESLIAATVFGWLLALFGYALFGARLHRWWLRLGVAILASLLGSVGVYAYGIDFQHQLPNEGRFWLMVGFVAAMNECLWLVGNCKCGHARGG